MKKATPKVSQKVAFTATNPEIHHYPDNRVEEEDQSQQKKILLSHPQYNINGKTLLNSIILMKIQMLQFHQHHHFIRRNLLLRNY